MAARARRRGAGARVRRRLISAMIGGHSVGPSRAGLASTASSDPGGFVAGSKRPSFLKRQKEQKRLARAAEKREARRKKKESKDSEADLIGTHEDLAELIGYDPSNPPSPAGGGKDSDEDSEEVTSESRLEKPTR